MSETEADTRANRIDPVLREAGWGEVEGSKVHRELICPGRITGAAGGRTRSRLTMCSAIVTETGGDRGQARRLGHTDGVGQAKDYATRLEARFAYSTNGIGWYGIDMQTGAEGDLALPFPTPEELWQRCFPEGNDWRDRFGAVPFETGGGKWQPRYYQHNAITAVLEAIAGARAHPADARHRHRQDLHRLPDRLEAVPRHPGTSAASRCAARASCSLPTATSSPTRPTTLSAPFARCALPDQPR